MNSPLSPQQMQPLVRLIVAPSRERTSFGIDVDRAEVVDQDRDPIHEALKARVGAVVSWSR
jgi:hypothetical protein